MKNVKQLMAVLLLLIAYAAPSWAQKNMVVVTTKGDIKSYPAEKVEGIEYDQKTDAYILHVGNERITYSADDLHNISYDDQYLVDMDSYIVPADDATQNPNLIVPGQENTNILELDTARFCATVEFKGDVPKLYVGSILMLQNDTTVVPCYVLTHHIEGKTARITYRNAELSEIFYNQTIVFGDEEQAAQLRRKAPGKRYLFGKIYKLLEFKEKLEKSPLSGISIKVDPSFDFKPLYVEKITALKGEGRNKRAETWSKHIEWKGNMALNTDLSLSTGTVIKVAKEFRFNGISKTMTFWAGYVPILVTMKLQPIMRAELESSANVSYNQNFQNEIHVEAEIDYDGFNDHWQDPIINVTPVNRQDKPSYFGTEGKVVANVYPVYPELSLEVYHAVGASVAVRPYFQFKHVASTKQGNPIVSSNISFILDAKANIYLQNPFSKGSRKTLLDLGPYQLGRYDFWAIPRRIREWGTGGNKPAAKIAGMHKTHILASNDSIIMGYKDTTSLHYQIYDYDYLKDAEVETACKKTSVEQQWFSDLPHDRQTPCDADSALLAQGLYPIGYPIYTQTNEDGSVTTHVECPAPGGYRRVLVTRILDGEGKVVSQTQREVGDEIKNFDATYYMSTSDGVLTGTIEYRNGGNYMKNTISSQGTAITYTYSDGQTIVELNMGGVHIKNPVEGYPPGAHMMCRPEYKVWDKLYYEILNGYAYYDEIEGVGRGEVMGLPCKTFTIDGSKNYFWHNLVLKVEGDGLDYHITSLQVLDK